VRTMSRVHAAVSACLGLVYGLGFAELIVPHLLTRKPHVGPLLIVFLRVHPYVVWVAILALPFLTSLLLFSLLGVKPEKGRAAWWVILKGSFLSFALEFLAINAFSPR